MPWRFKLTFMPEGRVEYLASTRGNYYDFEGEELTIHTAIVWCFACGFISEGKHIDSLEELDKLIADMKDPTTELYARLEPLPELGEEGGKQVRAKMLHDYERRRRWRAQRTAAPKCIYCGSTEIFEFPYNEPFAHPSGAGTITMECVGHVSTDFNQWFYSADGDRIG